MSSAPEHWFDRWDRYWDYRLKPFLIGVKVGIVLTVLTFIVSYIICGG